MRHENEDTGLATANRISELTLQLRQKELEMKEQYKREEKNYKTTHKLKETLGNAYKEHDKLMKQVMLMVKDREVAETELHRARLETERMASNARKLEYTVVTSQTKVLEYEKVLQAIA